MSRYTDSEWAAIIAQTEHDLVVSADPYPCPQVPSTAFTKTIDHTLLKLDVKEVQFDELCAEARRDRFAVGLPLEGPSPTDVRFLEATVVRLTLPGAMNRPSVCGRNMSSNAWRISEAATSRSRA